VGVCIKCAYSCQGVMCIQCVAVLCTMCVSHRWRGVWMSVVVVSMYHVYALFVFHSIVNKMEVYTMSYYIFQLLHCFIEKMVVNKLSLDKMICCSHV
jgi:hypothetical protein